MLFPFLLFTSAHLPAASSLRPYTHALLLPELFQYSPLCQCSSLDFIWMVQTHPSYRLQDSWFSSSVHEEPFHEFALKVLLDILGERFSLFSAEYRLKDEGSHNLCHVDSMYRCVRSSHPAVRRRCSHHCHVEKCTFYTLFFTLVLVTTFSWLLFPWAIFSFPVSCGQEALSRSLNIWHSA